ncbi:MAG: KamA family radical SAM protein [Anaerolineales bacterium]|nr:MAG: KamA family radical SAM protein [Anaerolineales bacterium]
MSVEATLITRPVLSKAGPEQSRRVEGVATRSSGQWYKDLWKHDPAIHRLLQESESFEVGRERLFNYLKDLEWKYRCGQLGGHKLEWATAMEALKVFYNILSPRNEQIAGFGTLTYLWRLARGDETVQDEIGPGFIEEFKHLFKAINGRAGLAQGWLGPVLADEGIEAVDFRQIEGRAAGQARSGYLDRVAEKVFALIRRHPTGLDPALVAKREKNRQRILDHFDATPHHWNNASWQLRYILRDMEGLEHLKQLVPLKDEEIEAVTLAIENQIPFGITPYYLSLFDFESAGREVDAQVRSQVIPPLHYVHRMMEHRDDREYYFDFMGEHDTSPVDLVTRRYATIAIIKPYDTCPQICVYCQRNWEITGPMMPGAMPSDEQLEKALDWFAAHPAIRDVLITGGDPLFLSDRRIKYINDRLSAMDHVINIRWASRAPVTVPMRITDELAELLGSYIEPGRRNVCFVTHIESAAEITPELAEAVFKLRRQGIYVYNQQVFTVETSRRFQTVANRIAMKKVGVDPYYTFYPKGKEETKDYLTPLARVAQERKEEARLLPGIFRTDEPVFNVPRLGKNHIRAWQDRELVAIRPDGRRVYLWHPWEKGITPMEPWPYVDNPIYEYLQELERLGEDPAEYESIWYYY